METTIILPESDEEHIIGNKECKADWCGSEYPKLHENCGGLIHAAFGDEFGDDYWLFTKCDKCEESED